MGIDPATDPNDIATRLAALGLDAVSARVDPDGGRSYYLVGAITNTTAADADLRNATDPAATGHLPDDDTEGRPVHDATAHGADIDVYSHLSGATGRRVPPSRGSGALDADADDDSQFVQHCPERDVNERTTDRVH
jgi:hypothetical protein